MSRPSDFTDYFVELMPMPRREARTKIGAVAHVLEAATSQTASAKARQKLLHAQVKTAARRPHPSLVDAFAAWTGEEEKSARAIVRAVSRALLGQVEREAVPAAQRPWAVAAMIRRASKWRTHGAEAEPVGDGFPRLPGPSFPQGEADFEPWSGPHGAGEGVADMGPARDPHGTGEDW